jgi:hypothetical protein
VRPALGDHRDVGPCCDDFTSAASDARSIRRAWATRGHQPAGSVVEKMLKVGATFDYCSRSLLKVRLYSL